MVGTGSGEGLSIAIQSFNCGGAAPSCGPTAVARLVAITGWHWGGLPHNTARMCFVQEELPLPMTPGNYQRRSSTCLLNRNFEKVVAKQEGFAWTNERPSEADAAKQKWGWIATAPGSWAELVVDATTDLGVSKLLLGQQQQQQQQQRQACTLQVSVHFQDIGAHRALTTPLACVPARRATSRPSRSRSSSPT